MRSLGWVWCVIFAWIVGPGCVGGGARGAFERTRGPLAAAWAAGDDRGTLEALAGARGPDGSYGERSRVLGHLEMGGALIGAGDFAVAAGELRQAIAEDERLRSLAAQRGYGPWIWDHPTSAYRLTAFDRAMVATMLGVCAVATGDVSLAEDPVAAAGASRDLFVRELQVAHAIGGGALDAALESLGVVPVDPRVPVSPAPAGVYLWSVLTGLDVEASFADRLREESATWVFDDADALRGRPGVTFVALTGSGPSAGSRSIGVFERGRTATEVIDRRVIPGVTRVGSVAADVRDEDGTIVRHELGRVGSVSALAVVLNEQTRGARVRRVVLRSLIAGGLVSAAGGELVSGEGLPPVGVRGFLTSRGVLGSEARADTRSWTTLPEGVWCRSVPMEAGVYDVRMVFEGAEGEALTLGPWESVAVAERGPSGVVVRLAR